MESDLWLFAHPSMDRHDPGHGHPERPDRLRGVREALVGASAHWLEPTAASREQIQRVHSSTHIDRVETLRGKRGALDGDTSLSENSVEAAYLAAGAAVDAVTAVTAGSAQHAFALVRPPGHHAEAQAAMGFCIFNNVAVAAEHALAECGCERVLIVDWDVHHGNGTQHSFWARRDVLFFSMHQFPFYPGTGDVDETGRDAGEGYNVNVPFPAGCDDGDYIAAARDLLVPMADSFAPDLVLVSAGFDAHRVDPLGGMNTTEEGFAAMTAIVRDIAAKHAQGRMVLTLEGGYDIGALGRSARACVDVLNGATAPALSLPPTRGLSAIKGTAGQHAKRWKL